MTTYQLLSRYFFPIRLLFLSTCVLLHTPTDDTAWIFIPKSYNTAGNWTHMSRVAPFIWGLSQDTLRSNLPWTQLRKNTNWNLLMLNLFRLLLPRVYDWRWTRTRGLEVPGRGRAGGRVLRTHRSLPVLLLPPTSPGFVHLRPRYSCLGECRLFSFFFLSLISLSWTRGLFINNNLMTSWWHSSYLFL